MSAIDTLIAQISDPRLRERLAAEWDNAKKEKKFGLVFEDHLPELLPLHGAKPRKGDLVCRRQGALKDVWQIKSIHSGMATCVKPSNEAHPSEPTRAAAEPVQFPVDELLVVREFGEPIFPALVPVDAVANGPADAPWHTLIEADNYHALQLLDYLYAGQVDCIYIDPPYNTGARDWKYNNDYVDGNDGWRHSKWLAFMEKRLKLAKRLLKPDTGVLIVTIDEKEYLHLGMLLEQQFPEARIQMISTMINPAVVARAGGFGRADEYIFVVMFGQAAPNRLRLSREWVSGKGRTHTGNIRWDLLRRSGTNAERSHSPGCFYPIYVNPKTKAIEKVGSALPEGVSVAEQIPGLVAVLPIRKNKTEGNWQWSPETFKERMRLGRVRVGGNEKRGFVIYILKDGEYAKIQRGEFQEAGRAADGSIIVEDADASFVLAVPGSQWRIASHDATQYGSRLLGDILPDRRFPFPKSLYAVRDTLRFYLEDKPTALTVDFFAGSGTTLNAVNLLNATDGGSRRCILVTNNEVSAEEAAALGARGLQPGDAEWEAQGICRSVTWPRSKYTILGRRDDGSVLTGEYLTGKTVEREKARSFTQIGFVDLAQLDTLPKKKQVVALIDGLPQTLVKDPCPFIVSEDHKATVLFDPAAAENWLEALDGQEHITDFYIVTPVKRVFDQLKAQVVELLGPILVPEEEKRPMSAGFTANLAYFKLDFLERERVSLRRAFREILPLLWLKAGAVGPRPELKRGEPEPLLFAPEGSNFVVLLDETRMGRLLKSLEGRTGLSQVFIVTDADESFKTMAQDVREVAGKANPGLAVVQLYRDYLLNFMINKNQDRAAGHTDTQGARA
ncbi:MAG: site-specific DNA-methyltransferase [Burkholderiaceae bacterium]|nr:site-specific DNA-methyltransferase [Burkholderiaceae bacterium]